MQKQKVIVSVINDLVTDQRLARSCAVLQELNYDVLLVGREQKNTQSIIPQGLNVNRIINRKVYDPFWVECLRYVFGFLFIFESFDFINHY